MKPLSIGSITDLVVGPSEQASGILGRLDEYKHLEHLIISGVDSDGFNLDFVASVPFLRKFQIHNVQTDTLDLSPLTSARFIKELEIISMPILGPLDLSPLVKCRALKLLRIKSCPLTMIDTSPLSSLSLDRLWFRSLELTAIDLLPICSSGTITFLDVSNNKLAEIDLSPLSNCTNFHILNISGNSLKSVELEQISGCRNFTSLVAEKNLFDTIDITPLSDMKHFGILYVSEGVSVIASKKAQFSDSVSKKVTNWY